MNAIDMSAFIAPKSDQLNADDLMGGPRTVTITHVAASPDSPEQPVAVSFDGDNGRPFKPCKSMRRVMVAAWGPDASQYVGRSMTIYRDPKVAFGGMQVGGIRISHMSHIDADMTLALTATRAKRAPYVVKRMDAPKNGLEDARTALEAAPDMAELERVWKHREMAPFRAQLQSVLEDCKAALTANDGTLAPDNPTAAEKRADEDMGEEFGGGDMISDELIAAQGDR